MKLGSNDISSIYLGANAVQKVYLGDNLVWTSFTGLLDEYPNAAAAYSLRQLKSGITNAIRVRVDTTGQPEYNIGFVDGQLDTATLEGYCAGGLDAYVETWYDQSGNGRNATQTIAANQPQIVNSGSVITENGKPSVRFDGSDDWFAFNSFNANTGLTEFSMFTVLQTDLTGESQSNQIISSNAANFSNILRIGAGNNGVFITTANNDQESGTLTTSQSLVGCFITNLGTYNSINGLVDTNYTNYSLNLGSNAYWSIGQEFDPGAVTSDFFERTIQELILYTSDQSSNRTGIETNINDFYSIYS